jgi:hypothetical protein
MKVNHNTDRKCAPSKKYIDGSCFTHEALIEIAKNYNNKNMKSKININLSKVNLVQELNTKLSNVCSEQTCWLKLDFIKKLNNEDILNNTFRPIGPSEKYDWLSTTHINEVIDQYHQLHNDFLFLGAVPYDFASLPVLGINKLDFEELEKEGKHKIGMVINLDEHYKSGSHWVALYTNLKKNQIYFFDSVGKKPGIRIRKFISKITKYLYNKKYNEKLPVNHIINNLKKINYLENNMNDNTLSNDQKTQINKILESNRYIKKILKGGFDLRYNHIQHQFKDSECGVYSINFIIRLVSGESFSSIINNITKDEDMNANRKVYFRNVN